MSGRRQRGMSIVELMVGIAVGMFVVAAASLLAASQLGDNKLLLLETQLQQDLRASLDIIVRELRRAGSNKSLAISTQVVWAPDSPSQPNAAANITVTPGTGGASSQVDFYTSRDSTNSGLLYGFRLNSSEGTIQTLLPGSTWQDLTDKKTMKVTAFTVTALNEPAVPLTCPKLCSDGTQACWPNVTVRSFRVNLTGQSLYDVAVVRSVQGVVRIRADEVGLNGLTMCPA